MSAIQTIVSTDFLLSAQFVGGSLSVLILIFMIIFHTIALFFKR